MSFRWLEMAPQPVINPASEIFNGQLNEVGRTYPIFNGVRTYTVNAGGEFDRIANAINGPVIERDRQRARITAPGRNTVSALMNVPTNGPWNVMVSVRAITTFANGNTQSSEAIRSILGSLPTSGSVAVRIAANPQFVNNTVQHEGRHAADIRRVCESVFSFWYTAISAYTGEWFDSKQALDEAVLRAAGLADYQGMRRLRLAHELVLRIGNGSDQLHHVVDRDRQFMIVNPRWVSATRTLEFSFQEAAAGPVARHRRHQARRVV